jgi:protoporphyrinogen oxidase
MDRRSFLKVSGGLILLSACKNEFSSKDGLQQNDFPIHIDSNSAVGHLVRSAMELPISESITTETLIVGSGIAGLAAASSLRTNDFVVCELDPTLGGTSGAININGSLYSQGEHYDLAYPNNYGKEGLKLLENLNIIQFNGVKSLWEFQDKHYLIPSDKEEACYDNGVMRSSILANTELKQNFLALLKTYDNQFPLPSTSIHADLHHLDHLTFYDYLNKYLPIDSSFIEAIDYQMLDDLGGISTQISALAGIHYYKCRPYYNGEDLELFSPQQGNYYFIQKMAQKMASESLLTNHLVFGMKQQNKHWFIDVYDTKQKIRKEYVTNNVVYAGQKHALKHIHPASHASFNDVSYAPWVVVNIELNDNDLDGSKWQNDFLSPNGTFLGFVDSKIQNNKNSRVLTAYYCFPDIHHYIVKNFEDSAKDLVHETVSNISLYYKKDISKFVKQAHIKLLGHAMPIPQPGYLTKKRTLFKDNLAFAGVDTGRLPLMFDALDSGIQAAKAINPL